MGALGGLQDRNLPASSLRDEAEGLPGVARECNNDKHPKNEKIPAQKKASSCRQAESLLDMIYLFLGVFQVTLA